MASPHAALLLPLVFLPACGAPPAPVVGGAAEQPGSAVPSASAASPTASGAPANKAAVGSRRPPRKRATGDIGTPHPVVVDAASPWGSWVVVCQARQDEDANGRIAVELDEYGHLTGDPLRPYLVEGDGPGEAIDELLGYDPSGRWLVIRVDDQPRLVDSATGKRTALEHLDSRADAVPYLDHRTVSFGGRGEKLAFLRQGEEHPIVVVRSLATGDEATIDPGPGQVWRLALDLTGQWVGMLVIAEDTSGNGRLGWPVPESSRRAGRCTGPVARHAAWQDRGDTPVMRVARASGGNARTVPDLIAPLDQQLLVRLPGGELFAQPWKGRRRRFGEGACMGHLVHADPTRQLALFACELEEGRPELELRGVGFLSRLKIPVSGQAVGTWPLASPRLVPVYPGQDALLMDFETRKPVALKPRDTVLLTAGSRALVRREDDLLIADVDAKNETRLVKLPDPLPDVVTQRPLAAVSPFVIDVAQGRVVGTFAGRPLALTDEGRVLIAAGQDARGKQLAMGPLRWLSPTPIEPATDTSE